MKVVQFEIKYTENVSVAVFGSEEYYDVFTRKKAACWGDKPWTKRVHPKEIEGESYYYLVFYSKQGCERI